MAGSYRSQPEFGDLLRRARHASGLTQEELAERAGLSARGISDLERGARRVPQHMTVSLLADALHLSDADRAEWEQIRRAAARSNLSPGQPPGSSDAPVIPVAHSLSSLVGRQREILEIIALLQDAGVRLLTLTGPGGVGKTRLVLAVSEQLGDAFANGARMVSLAPLSDHRAVLSAIAAALPIAEQPDVPLLDLISGQIAERQLLMVLDNFEHVIEAASDIARLLAACPGLQVLATSRTPLHISGEHEYPVQPLALPDAAAGAAPDRISDTEAVRLFIERARAVQPGFTLTGENSGDVEAICRRLDGLPLAIELAAARLRVFSPGELLARLDQPLALLTGGPRDLPDRQRTLRNTIAWSYDLLSDDEQRLFRALSVCRGGWTIETAAALSGRSDGVVDGVEALVEHSLAQRFDQPGNPARFGVLETVREFGLEQLGQLGELENARKNHAHHFFDWAERNAWRIYDGGDVDAVARIDSEIDNVRAAFDWALSCNSSDTTLLDPALHAGGVLWGYWRARGLSSEGRRWIELALSLPGASDDARMDGLNGAGYLAAEQGDLILAIAYHEEALAISLDRKNLERQVYALWGIGRAAMWHGDQLRAIDAYDQALVLARQAGRYDWMRNLLGGLGMARFRLGDHTRAEQLLCDALDIPINEDGQDPIRMTDLAHIITLRGDVDAARELLLGSLPMLYDQGPSRLVADALEVFAWLAIREAQPVRATRLLGAAAVLRVDIGAPRPPADRARYESLIEQGKQQLSVADWEAGWKTGTEMTLDDAVEFALGIDGEE